MKIPINILFILLGTMVFLASSGNSFGQDKDLFQKKTFQFSNGDSLLYRILFPKDYEKGKEFPLVLFLHGAGERGNDNEKQLIHGASLFLEEENREKFPAIVVFPQCPEDQYWIDISIRSELRGKGDPDFDQTKNAPSEELTMVNKLVEHLVKNEKVNKKRLYLMGLSMGGFGTFETLGRWPKKYAAAVAICGGGNLSLTKKYAKNTAVWIAHGAKDDIVPIELSEKIYNQLKDQGAEVMFTVYPDANHNSWDPTFENPALLPWLFSHKK
ncbi:prolyl oligopeptidase family serine peptidase [Echinicola jeungdonensis]|uniref:Prolyl oligopeptidase family serine peptidase n=1 Tax=Echinicola jeungdonensis TaxID=709343 RepID=A0ABV5J9T4_9BACT|nr:prolyl oligopeptidase family serine peptidase [Echinicola jeungdonensis]MDN3670238.1 prolyl oligopeptidase family serine peptidase [Echinicola jeungdonensis]